MSGSLILIGAPGSGKSSVLDALSTMLEIDDVPFGAIETEQLARGWPWLKAAQWIPQLEAVVELQRRAGRQIFLVVATTENEQELRAVVNAVGAQPVLIVCLSAPPDLAARRVAEREPDSWRGKLPRSTTHAEVVPVRDPSPDMEEVLGRIQRLAHGGGVENNPRRARRSRSSTHRAQERPAEPAPLRLRRHIHVVDASDIAGNKDPRTSSEMSVDPRNRMPGTGLVAACKRQQALAVGTVLGDVGRELGPRVVWLPDRLKGRSHPAGLPPALEPDRFKVRGVRLRS
jgi:hypothetical protein